jgi:hypothetical protein
MVVPQILNRVDNQAFARDHVVVFVGPNCPQCERAVQDARALANCPVEVMDIGTPYAAQLYRALRVSGLPVTVAGSQMLVGAERRSTDAVLGGAGMRENNQTPP